jgi:hypothetical protein
MARYVTGPATQLTFDPITAVPYPFTLAFWYKPATGVNTPVLYYGGGPGNAYDVDLYETTPSTSYISSYKGNVGNWNGHGMPRAPVGVWNHIVLVFDTAYRAGYVNGIKINQSTFNIGNPTPLTLKALTTGGIMIVVSGYTGDIADIGFWNVQLTDADAARLYAGWRPGSIYPSALKGWWKLSEGGDLANSASHFPAFNAIGDVPATPDPPQLTPTRPGRFIVEATERDWLPFSRVTVPLDDVLNRRLKGVYPMTEAGSNRIINPSAPVTGDVAIAPGSSHYWETDGGIYFVGGGVRSAPSLVVPWPDVTVSVWLKHKQDGGVVPWALGQYGGWSGIYAGYDAPTRRVNCIKVFGADFGNIASVSMMAPSSLSATEYGHVVVTMRGDTLRMYFNGKLEQETIKFINAPGIVNQFTIAGDFSMTNPWYGSMRDLRTYSEALAPQQVRELYLRGYAKRDAPTIRPQQFPVRISLPGDPSEVPPNYEPNTDLAWVQKATHIWALHPTDPLKADKGGLHLQPVVGTQPAPAAQLDNTMQFSGGQAGVGSANDASYYETIGSFIFGDNPAVAGNQTPPAIGGMAAWVMLSAYSPSGVPDFLGQRSNYAGAGAATAGFGVGTTGLMVWHVGSPQAHTSPTLYPRNSWLHIVGTNDGVAQKVWVNGTPFTFAPSTAGSMYDEKMQFGAVNKNFAGNIGALRLRQVAVINGATWSDAEILEMYQRPYAYYSPVPPIPQIKGELRAEGYSDFLTRARLRISSPQMRVEGLSDLLSHPLKRVGSKLFVEGRSETSTRARLAKLASLIVQGQSDFTSSISKLITAGLFVEGDSEIAFTPYLATVRITPGVGRTRQYDLELRARRSRVWDLALGGRPLGD